MPELSGYPHQSPQNYANALFTNALTSRLAMPNRCSVLLYLMSNALEISPTFIPLYIWRRYTCRCFAVKRAMPRSRISSVSAAE